MLRSHNGNTTRKRDQASHAQNNVVERPAMSGPLASPTASTSPAPRPTAACAARALGSMPSSRRRPLGAWCAPNPCNPSRPAADGRHRRGSARASGPPTPRSSPRTLDPRPRPTRHGQPATRRLARGNPMRDGLVITPSQLRRTTQRASQIKRLQDLHHFLRTLQRRPPGTPRSTRRPELPAGQDETLGRSDGHPRGEPTAVTGEFRRPPVGRFPWPPSHAMQLYGAEGPGT